MPYTPPPELRNLSLVDIITLSNGRKLPPVETWKPQHISDSKMQILSDGRWFHDGGEIKRHSMIRAFSSLLRKDGDGYWLVTPYEKQSIIVDDAPFIACEVHSIGKAKDRHISIRLNTSDIIIMDEGHRLNMKGSDENEHIPYINIRNNLLAKFTRSAAYELYEWAIEECEMEDDIGLWSGGIYFSLGTMA